MQSWRWGDRAPSVALERVSQGMPPLSFPCKKPQPAHAPSLAGGAEKERRAPLLEETIMSDAITVHNHLHRNNLKQGKDNVMDNTSAPMDTRTISEDLRADILWNL